MSDATGRQGPFHKNSRTVPSSFSRAARLLKPRVIEETKGTAIIRRNYGGVSALAQTREAWPSTEAFFHARRDFLMKLFPPGESFSVVGNGSEQRGRSQTGSALCLVNKNRSLARSEIKPFLFHFARTKTALLFRTKFFREFFLIYKISVGKFWLLHVAILFATFCPTRVKKKKKEKRSAYTNVFMFSL